MMDKGYEITLGGTITDSDGQKMAGINYIWSNMSYEVATTFELALLKAINDVVTQFGQEAIAAKKTK